MHCLSCTYVQQERCAFRKSMLYCILQGAMYMKKTKVQWNLPKIVNIDFLKHLDKLCPFCKKDSVFTLPDRQICLECHAEWVLEKQNHQSKKKREP